MELPAGDICTIFEKRGGYVLNCFTARTPPTPVPQRWSATNSKISQTSSMTLHSPLVSSALAGGRGV